MIVQRDFINKLKDFGLNSYESKLWTALLSRGISTAGELSDIANVPRSRSYDVLESLEKKGFIVMKLGKPIKYIAVQPEEVLERVKKRIKADAERQSVSLDKLKESKVVEELNLLHTQGVNLIEPSNLSGAIKGRTNVYNHLESMIKNAKKSISIMTTEEGFLRKADVLSGVLAKAKERGVKVKLIVPRTKQTVNGAKLFSKGIDIKYVDSITARFSVIDSAELLFMVLNDTETHPSYDVGIWVTTPFFAGALDAMFSTIWQSVKKA